MKNENLKKNKDNFTVYDFKLPPKFSPKNFRELEIIHKDFCKKVSFVLTNYLKMPVKLDYISADQILYENFNASKSDTFASYTPCLCFKINTNENFSIIRLDYESASGLINRALGGDGTSENAPVDLNEIEKAVFKKIGERMTRSLEDTFQTSRKFYIQSLKVENHCLQGICILVNFEIKIRNNLYGLMSICYPYSVINSVLRSSTNRNVIYFDGNEKSKTYEALMQTPLELKAVLKESEFKLKDFKNLNVGDVLPMGILKNENIRIKIGNTDKFLAKRLSGTKIEIIKRIEK